MTGAQQLKAALARKNGTAPEAKRVPVPAVIVYASERGSGTYMAKGGKPYTITYAPVEA